MQYIAEAKNVKISPRKVRLVADSVKDLHIVKAIASLSLMHKRAAIPLRKTLESAVANAVNNHKAEKSALSIKEIMVNEGIRYKRYHFAGRGRMRPYKKRTSHIRIVLESQPGVETRQVTKVNQEGGGEVKDQKSKVKSEKKNSKV